MFTPTLRCECAQPASDRLMRKWCIDANDQMLLGSCTRFSFIDAEGNAWVLLFLQKQTTALINIFQIK